MPFCPTCAAAGRKRLDYGKAAYPLLVKMSFLSLSLEYVAQRPLCCTTSDRLEKKSKGLSVNASSATKRWKWFTADNRKYAFVISKRGL